jgi:TRAP-type C4-dicarboxylate transport system permease small subunit
MNTHSKLNYIVRLYDWGALACFSSMMACILIEVFSRNIIHVPTTWAEEASRLFCVWSVFLGSASAWFRGAHIIIHVLVSRLTGRVKLYLQIFVDILTAIFLLSVWFGTIFIMKINYPTKTTALEISISYFYLGLFLGLTGMIIFHANNMVHTLRGITGSAGKGR